MKKADFLIIGAGIVGLSLARELKLRYASASVLVLEKDLELGRHSSGRNSGVMHSGIYYAPDSLKAKMCRQGAIEMADYHEQHRLPLSRRGKVLVAVNVADGPQLDLLTGRARANGVGVEEIDRKGLQELEPEARSAVDRALWVPSTTVGSPAAVMPAMLAEVKGLGVCLRCQADIAHVDYRGRTVRLRDGVSIGYGHAINAAGLHADSVAHLFDVGHRYTLVPFKGIYWKLSPDSGLRINHLIYPVPDLRVPFLGVHTTTTTDGTTYLGPTAVPAFGRENYRGFQDVTPAGLTRIVGLLARQYTAGHDGFRRLAWQEGRRYFKPWFVEAAQAILPRLRAEHLLPSDKVGIRAQMLDKRSGRLVTDFLIEKGENSTHVLNAISPAWTCAFPFARYVCDNYLDAAGGSN